MNRKQIISASVERNERIQKYLVEKGFENFATSGKRIRYGMIPEIAKETGYKISDVKSTLDRMKCKVTGPSPARNLPNCPPSYIVLDDGGYADIQSSISFKYGKKREMPKPENIGCETLSHAILDVFPRHGGSAYMGTPTALCASNHPKTKVILNDNLKVYDTLQLTSDNHPFIFIGNIVDNGKAKSKGHEFKSFITSYRSQVMVQPIDAQAFYDIGRQMALHYNPAKLVFQSGGIWSFSKPTQKKFEGWNLNFQDAAERLSKKYHNLHILAMIKEEEFAFDIIYLHKGETKKLDRYVHPADDPNSQTPKYEWKDGVLVQIK
jgi:hypothetical protein